MMVVERGKKKKSLAVHSNLVWMWGALSFLVVARFYGGNDKKECRRVVRLPRRRKALRGGESKERR